MAAKLVGLLILLVLLAAFAESQVATPTAADEQDSASGAGTEQPDIQSASPQDDEDNLPEFTGSGHHHIPPVSVTQSSTIGISAATQEVTPTSADEQDPESRAGTEQPDIQSASLQDDEDNLPDFTEAGHHHIPPVTQSSTIGISAATQAATPTAAGEQDPESGARTEQPDIQSASPQDDEDDPPDYGDFRNSIFRPESSPEAIPSSHADEAGARKKVLFSLYSLIGVEVMVILFLKIATFNLNRKLCRCHNQ